MIQIINLILTIMKQTNLDFLFQHLILDFAHLVTIEPMTKGQFIETVKNHCNLNNPKNDLFYHSILRCDFETIRLGDNCILFNS